MHYLEFHIPDALSPPPGRMDIATLRHYLDDADAAQEFLKRLGVVDPRRAHAALVSMASAGVTLDLLAGICDQLGQNLARCPDPDMALNNLDRFVAQARNPLSIGTLFERDATALPTLIQIFSTSQHFSDLLIADPEGFDLLRLTEGAPVARQMLVEDLVAEISALEHEQTVLRSLRRFKHRETLRITYGDIIREQSLQTVTRADFLPGRRHSRRGPPRRLAKAPRAAGRPHRPRRPARPASSSWGWASSAAAS